MIRWRVSRLAWAMAAVPLLLVPALVMAQRGMGGGGRGRSGGGGKEGGGIARDAGIAVPKLVNAVNLLVEHKQDLALSDTQFVRIIALKRSLDSTNAPLMRRVDSVQRVFKGGSMLLGDPSPARRDSLAIGRSIIVQTQVGIRDNISAWRDKAYGLLSATQADKAQEFEDKAQRAIADEEQGRGRRG
ncbi:MAG TPA: hypothetical protein VII52_06680 [Gemmatimonadaceae bacterium]